MPTKRSDRAWNPAYLRALALAVLLAAAAAALGYQLAEPGYYIMVNFDAAMGPKYATQFMESFGQGVLYPRWMADDFNGMGSPAFVYYSPLSYFLASILSMSGMGLPAAFSLVFLIGLYAGGVCMFLLVNKRYGYMAGMISGLCFILLPTRIADFYLLNTLSGRSAQAWLPAVLLFTDMYMDGPFSRRNLALTAVAYAGLVMSHIATAFIFTPFVIAFGLFGREQNPVKWPSFLRLAGGLLTGLCLAAVYFLPALVERGFAQIEFFQVAHDFRKFFIFNILSRHETVPIEGMLTIMRLTSTFELFFAAAFFYMAVRTPSQGRRRGLIFFAGAMVACIAMMSSPSAMIWESVPGVSTTGYPARFGALNATFAAALTGICASAVIKGAARKAGPVALVAVFFALTLAADAFLISHSNSYTQEETASIAGRIYLPEYLPKTADLSTVKGIRRDAPLLNSDGEFTYDIERWDHADRLFVVDAGGPLLLEIKTFYFPGWKAWVDGKETGIGVEDKTGAMLLDLPAGKHSVELRFTDTWPRKAGWIISVLTLAVLLFPYGRFRALRLKSG